MFKKDDVNLNQRISFFLSSQFNDRNYNFSGTIKHHPGTTFHNFTRYPGSIFAELYVTFVQHRRNWWKARHYHHLEGSTSFFHGHVEVGDTKEVSGSGKEARTRRDEP